MAVSHVATGAKSSGGTTTVSIASPAGTASGQMLLAFRAGWIPATSWTDETDWTASGHTTTGGTGSSVDAHTTAIRADRRILTGSLAGPTVFDQTHSSNAGTIGIMLSYQHAGGGFDTVATGTGDDATHGTNRSITTSGTINLAVDDVVVVGVATDTDTNLASFANQAITASGITFGSTTRRSPASAGVSTGGDGNIEVFEATVTAGSGTVAVTLAFDTATNQCGPGVFVRLREVASGPNDGAATGAISWAGAATGTTVRSGAASGSIGWVGAATGVAVHNGSATGSISWAGAAAGESDLQGAAAGAIGWAGTATGETDYHGAATGSVSWAGSATGTTVRSGAATGSITWAGTAAGTTEREGAATGSITWAGSATGEAPGVGVQEGSAEGTITWVGSATGVSAHQGAATGSINWAGTATGITARAGAATGSITWSGVASGVEPSNTFWTPDPVQAEPDPVEYTTVGLYTPNPAAYQPL